MTSDKIWGECGFFDKCAWKRKKGRDVKGVRDAKLLTDLVRRGETGGKTTCKGETRRKKRSRRRSDGRDIK